MGRTIKKIFVILLFISFAFSQSLIKKLRVPVYIKFQTGLGYDSNFLKLSDTEINEVSFYPSILGGAADASSYIVSNYINFNIKPHLISDYKSKIELKIKYNKYFSASHKSYGIYGVVISQNLGRYKWLKYSYSSMPNFYLRDYRDRDEVIVNQDSKEILKNCFFSQGSSTLSYSHPIPFKKTWIELSANYKTQYYNPEFTEYDLEILSYGLKINTKYLKKYFISFNLVQTDANNITYNNGLSSTYSNNRGYLQDYFSFLFSKKNINYAIFQEFGVKYSMHYRKFISIHKLDLLHYQRKHEDSNIDFWLIGNINSIIKYKLYFSKRNRMTFSEHDWVEELKGFNKFNYMLSITYNFSSNILY